MVRARSHRVGLSSRPGKVLVMLALVLTLLLGMVGLVIDSGFLHAGHRGVQNAADSGALAAAMELFRGNTVDNAKAAASDFVKTYNGLANATVTVNIPPTSGPYNGNGKYAEVIVENKLSTYLIQVLGASSSQTVSARAVAGYEAVTSGEGAIVLDANQSPGISVSGGGSLVVDGSVVVNSQGAGLDQYGNTIDWGQKKYAATTSNNSTVKARLVMLRGGVDTVANYVNYDSGGPNPIFAGAALVSDPLRTLAIPTDANGVVTTTPTFTDSKGVVTTSPTFAGGVGTLSPGIWNDIQIQTGDNVTFKPGIYVLSPTKNNQGLRVTGNPTINGSGVMFYVTGSSYASFKDPKTNKTVYGYYDALDDSQNSYLDLNLPPTYGSSTMPSAPDPGGVKWASVTINATTATVNLTGLSDATSPFNNILFYQRRRNTSPASIAGKAGDNVNLGGTIYGRWVTFSVSGQGKYNAQFLVGSMAISGGADVTILSAGKNYGRADQVFLVE